MTGPATGLDRTPFDSRIAAHALWLQSEGREGVRLSISDADLSGFDLRGVDLRHAELKNCRLRQTRLQVCRLNHADLTGAGGLLPAQLAGADLTGAALPAKLPLEAFIKPAQALVLSARKALLIILLAVAYTWLTIATTTDIALLTGSHTSPLPVILTELPVTGFFWAAPLILLGCHCYLHLQLQRLWEGLAVLPAVLPDGRALPDALPPWLLTSLVETHSERLRDHQASLIRLQNGIALLLAWWVIPLTLGALWLRFLPRHDMGGSAFQLACLALAALSGVGFYRLAVTTLSRGHRTDRSRRRMPGYWLSAVLAFGSVLLLAPLLSYGVIAAPPLTPSQWFDPRGWGPQLLTTLGYPPHADFRGHEVSQRPALWNDTAGMLEGVRGAELAGTNLHHLLGRQAFLVKADLHGALLRRAELELADLRQARLDGADLHSANLLQADLRGANLAGADLRDAALLLARLQDARFDRADLRGAFLNRAELNKARLNNADLRGAQLTGADLRGSDLTLAILRDADLRDADLRGSLGLQCLQVQSARVDDTTRLPETLACPPSE